MVAFGPRLLDDPFVSSCLNLFLALQACLCLLVTQKLHLNEEAADARRDKYAAEAQAQLVAANAESRDTSPLEVRPLCPWPAFLRLGSCSYLAT